MKTHRLLWGACLLLLLTGCAGIGAGTVSRDRFDYTEAISDSWKRQMLLNMVKMRYGDAPVFLDVASVINQYALTGSINLNASWIHNAPVSPYSAAQAVGAVGAYEDRPTITYSPLMGERFARELMTPIPPAAILSLIQGGYPADLVFRLSVHSINGIRNRFGGAARAHGADPEFYPLLEKMRSIQSSGAVGMRVKKGEGKEEAWMMVFRAKREEKLEADKEEVRKILGLDPKAQEFRVVYGAISRDDQEIAILSRSMLEILTDLASSIEVPPAHVTEKRVNPTLEEQVGDVKVPPLIRVSSSPSRPADVFVAVPCRDHWFWIDDRDLRSKSVFSFLMFIFTLLETPDKGGTPIVTIPTR